MDTPIDLRKVETLRDYFTDYMQAVKHAYWLMDNDLLPSDYNIHENALWYVCPGKVERDRLDEILQKVNTGEL